MFHTCDPLSVPSLQMVDGFRSLWLKLSRLKVPVVESHKVVSKRKNQVGPRKGVLLGLFFPSLLPLFPQFFIKKKKKRLSQFFNFHLTSHTLPYPERGRPFRSVSVNPLHPPLPSPTS